MVATDGIIYKKCEVRFTLPAGKEPEKQMSERRRGLQDDLGRAEASFLFFSRIPIGRVALLHWQKWLTLELFRTDL